LLLAALTAGCATSDGNGHGARTPNEAIEAAYRLCQAGNLKEVVQFFDGGLRVWDQAPGLVTDTCARITEDGSLKGWEYGHRTVTGDSAAIFTNNYLDADRTVYGRRLGWVLVRKHGRWLITEVI
jgi:hypothetical protein